MCLKCPQQGFATLSIIIVMIIALTTITLTSARSSKSEQMIASNDVRAQEVQAAAEAGLEFAIAWASQNSIPWTGFSDLQVNCGRDLGCPTLPSNLAGNDGGAFTLSITYQRRANSPNFIKVTAIATQIENNASASNSCYINAKGMRIPGTWRDF